MQVTKGQMWLFEDPRDHLRKRRETTKGTRKKNRVTNKKTKVRPNLGRAGGSKKEVRTAGNKKTKPPPPPEVEEVIDDDYEDEDDDEDADDDDNASDEDDNSEDDDEEDDNADESVDEGKETEDWEGSDNDSSDDKVIETDDRRGTTTSFSQKRFREHLERMNSDRKKGGGMATRHKLAGVVDSTAGRTKSKSASSGVDLDQVLVHVYTAKESLRNREAHVATWVRSFVKNILFRNIKFVNTESMIQKAMKLVMKFENVADHKKLEFHMLYESVFNEALNTKRSSCEQAGGKIVMEALTTMKADEFYTIEGLCKLRRATTRREKEAFYWFFGSSLECVSGKKAWGKAKYTSMVSKAATTDKTQGKIVTVSDEAFALLLFEDNYIEKWIEMAAESAKEKEETLQGERDKQDKKKTTERRRGKYTGASVKSGHCKFRGWSTKGMKRFNEFFALVKEDRASPQATTMEGKLLEFCNSKRPHTDGNGVNAVEQGETEEAARILENLEPPVEAMWDTEEV